jgi:hypothetical protein
MKLMKEGMPFFVSPLLHFAFPLSVCCAGASFMKNAQFVDAVSRLAEAVKLLPESKELQKLLQDAQEALKQQEVSHWPFSFLL